ncbi:MAG: HNH endonuclease [bacterium]|nr:HNH endonuclease [bacterium]
MSIFDAGVIYYDKNKYWKDIIMFGKKQLKELSHICAYCGKALKDKDKTLDHILPQCAGGKSYANNIVICCSNCNTRKGNLDINSFLSNSEQRLENFVNYLKLIDIQRGNNNYSQAVLKKINNSLYIKEYKSKRDIRIKEEQNIAYNIYGTDVNFKVNETQMKILDYYIKNPEFTNYKELARILNLSYTEIKNHIIQINNLTGIFILKNIGKNGIKMNELFYHYLNVEQVI